MQETFYKPLTPSLRKEIITSIDENDNPFEQQKLTL